MNTHTIVSIVYLAYVSLLFGALYSWRMYTDFKVFIKPGKQPNQPLAIRHKRGFIILFATMSLAHALAFMAAQAMNIAVIDFLRSLIIQIFVEIIESVSLSGLLLLLLMLVSSVVYSHLKARRRPAATQEKTSSILKNELRSRSAEYGMKLAIIAIIVVVLIICYGVYFVMAEFVPSSVATFIGDWLMSAGTIIIAILLYLRFASRWFIKKNIPGESSDEADKIWSEVFAIQLKETVWYGAIFLFVPCLLYRWPVMFETYTPGQMEIYIVMLAGIHSVAILVGGGLDWLGSKKWREKSGREVERVILGIMIDKNLKWYGYEKEVPVANREVQFLFKHDWQPEAIIFFTRMKDLAMIIPMAFLSWAYFVWTIMKM